MYKYIYIYIYISDQQHSFFAVHCFWIHHSWSSISRKVVIKETPLREIQDDLLRCWVVEGWVDLSGTRMKASLIHVIRSAALLFCRPLFLDSSQLELDLKEGGHQRNTAERDPGRSTRFFHPRRSSVSSP